MAGIGLLLNWKILVKSRLEFARIGWNWLELAGIGLENAGIGLESTGIGLELNCFWTRGYLLKVGWNFLESAGIGWNLLEFAGIRLFYY